ncbi:hypothetical protein TROLL_1 [Bacillus phage Troll]|uniref:Uncharacterized protein n=1 Tax=Bacillus phage Troll TaxID=1382932 RepID=S5YPL3_9CAUD|nr:hypothetical protein TROLL_1 [Bacillus phage Troll]AGT13443.1 hypothetical protein TROLL_1 [Bacillus phage Troll]
MHIVFGIFIVIMIWVCVCLYWAYGFAVKCLIEQEEFDKEIQRWCDRQV